MVRGRCDLHAEAAAIRFDAAEVGDDQDGCEQGQQPCRPIETSRIRIPAIRSSPMAISSHGK